MYSLSSTGHSCLLGDFEIRIFVTMVLIGFSLEKVDMRFRAITLHAYARPRRPISFIVYSPLFSCYYLRHQTLRAWSGPSKLPLWRRVNDASSLDDPTLQLIDTSTLQTLGDQRLTVWQSNSAR